MRGVAWRVQKRCLPLATSSVVKSRYFFPAMLALAPIGRQKGGDSLAHGTRVIGSLYLPFSAARIVLVVYRLEVPFTP